jgi:hypothetical protein
MCGSRPDLEYDYAGVGSGRVAKHLADPRVLSPRSVAGDARGAIQCDEHSPFQ